MRRISLSNSWKCSMPSSKKFSSSIGLSGPESYSVCCCCSFSLLFDSLTVCNVCSTSLIEQSTRFCLWQIRWLLCFRLERELGVCWELSDVELFFVSFLSLTFCCLRRWISWSTRVSFHWLLNCSLFEGQDRWKARDFSPSSAIKGRLRVFFSLVTPDGVDSPSA